MNYPKLFRKIFAIILIGGWLVYAACNMATRLPYLQRGYESGWSFASRLEGITTAANSGVLFQERFQDLSANIERALNKKTSNNFLLVRSENQQYMYSTFYTFEAYSFVERALQLREVQRVAQKQGASLLYLNCLDLHTDEDSAYGEFPVANLNPRADAFLYDLQSYGIDFLDSRELLKESALPKEEYRYNTESHWTTQASFEVYLGLIEKLQEQGVDIDPEGSFADRNSFVTKLYSYGFVGDLGKKIGIPNAEPEGFELIVPDFETDFTLEYPIEVTRPVQQGDFSTILINDHWLKTENPYEQNFYNAYLTAEYNCRIIKNNQNTQAPKILVIGDAYMLPVTAFLATAASEIHLLWPYGLPDNQSLLDYLDENKFDSIVVGMNPGMLDGSGFNYLREVEIPELIAGQ